MNLIRDARENRVEDRPFCLTETAELRPYQVEATRTTLESEGRGSILVLPCGAGKTHVGTFCIVKECERKGRRLVENFLIVVPGQAVAQQWLTVLREATTAPASAVCIFPSEGRDSCRHTPNTRIFIATYQFLTSELKGREWHSLREKRFRHCILDECHQTPAEKYSSILEWNVERWTGLTASPLRNDGMYSSLVGFVGHESTPVPWKHLEEEGFINQTELYVIRCPLPNMWRKLYETASPSLQLLLERFNPRKLILLEKMLRHWRERKLPTLVFSDCLQLLQLVERTLKLETYTGELSDAERQKKMEAFRRGEITTLLISRAGEMGLDMPSVCRVVQIDALGSSARQQTQRVGRGMRKHPGKPTSHFYDVISDTEYGRAKATLRSKFLRQQNYEVDTYDVNTSGGTAEGMGDYQPDEDGRPWEFATWDLQEKMLLDVLERARKEEAARAASADESYVDRASDPDTGSTSEHAPTSSVSSVSETSETSATATVSAAASADRKRELTQLRKRFKEAETPEQRRLIKRRINALANK